VEIMFGGIVCIAGPFICAIGMGVVLYCKQKQK
jgi:hypothetical protein